MKKYLAAAKILFKAQIVYRFDVIMTAFAAAGRVLFAWILWGTIFASRETIGGFTLKDMLLYYLLVSFLASLEMSEGVSGEISGRIRNGTFSRYMVLPVNPQLHFIAQSFGAVGYYGIFALITAAFSIAVFGIQLNLSHDILCLICALLMIPAGLVFMISYHFFIGILTFKFQDIGFFRYLQRNLIALITGTLFPLSLLPDSVLELIRFLPFTYVTYSPAMLLSGKADLNTGLFGLAIIAIWTAGMLLISHKAYKKLSIKYDGVGI